MSDNLAAAAAALGLPEALVDRSAKARAAETGASAEDILVEWAGGQSAPRLEPAPADAPEGPEGGVVVEEMPSRAPTPAPVVVEIPAQPRAPQPEPVPAGPYKPPVLVGAIDRPMTVLAGVIGLFFIVVMVGLVGPSIPTEAAGARTSHLPYSDAALDGRQVYLTAGCAACHTQMVRPVVADVGLGAVSLSDTNQVLGTRRFGPDLSDVGSRISSDQFEAIVEGLGSHPAHSLSATELANLGVYLSESATSAPEGQGS